MGNYISTSNTGQSGLTPSSTEESNSKSGVVSEDRPLSSTQEKPSEEPESIDTSYGVEATAVRTLAASTGTVAILGTTAKSQLEKNDNPEVTSTQKLISDNIVNENEVIENNTEIVIEKIEDINAEVNNELNKVIKENIDSAEQKEDVKNEDIKEKIENHSNEQILVDALVEEGNESEIIEKLFENLESQQGENELEVSIDIKSELPDTNNDSNEIISNQQSETNNETITITEIPNIVENNLKESNSYPEEPIIEVKIELNDSQLQENIDNENTEIEKVDIMIQKHTTDDNDVTESITEAPVHGTDNEIVEMLLNNGAKDSKMNEELNILETFKNNDELIPESVMEINNLTYKKFETPNIEIDNNFTNSTNNSLDVGLIESETVQTDEKVTKSIITSDDSQINEVTDRENSVLLENDLKIINNSQDYINDSTDQNNKEMSEKENDISEKTDNPDSNGVNSIIITETFEEPSDSFNNATVKSNIKRESDNLEEEDITKSISSEQLRTNSFSDGSLSEAMNIELLEDTKLVVKELIDMSVGKEAESIGFEEKSPTDSNDKVNSEIDITKSNSVESISLKENINIDDDNLEKIEKMDTLSDSLIETVKEEVNEICRKAVETTYLLNNPIDNIENEKSEKDIINDNISNDKIDELDILPPPPNDLELNSANNNEQIFNSDDKNDEMDFPPPLVDDEYIFGEQINDSELPPPDFENLDSSLIEDLNTGEIQEANKDLQEDILLDSDEKDLSSLQKPQECAELPEQRKGSLTLLNDDMLANAATKIQANIRGFLARKKVDSMKEKALGPKQSNTSVSPVDSIKETSEDSSRFTRGSGEFHDVVVLPPTTTDLSEEISNDNVNKLENTIEQNMMTDQEAKAATKIQASFRGYNARKNLKRLSDNERDDSLSKKLMKSENKHENNEIIADEIKLEEEKLEETIVEKIKVAEDKVDNEEEVDKEKEDQEIIEENINETKPDVNEVNKDNLDVINEDNKLKLMNNSATKIQAGVRGYLTRKELESKKNAVTKIQAGFRGFKTRKELDRNKQLKEDYL